MPSDTIDMTPAEHAALRQVIARHGRVEGSSKFLFSAVMPPVKGSPRDRADKADVAESYALAGALLSGGHCRRLSAPLAFAEL
jgi:hypothetical protein